jgi:16S rRNA A1518/A1519 N6-dimethyltransferase RsmA/KsgA/DIM1 with predicted DNA glycosylase/AP lyase activity
LRLTPWPDPQKHWKVKSPELCFQIIRAAFGQRRKQLRNALADVLPPGLTLPEISGRMLSQRAETLSLGDFVRFSNDVFDFSKER